WVAPDLADVSRGRRMLRLIEVPHELKVEPKLGLHTKQALEPQGGIRRHAALTVHELVDTRIRDSQLLGQRRLAQVKGLEKLLEQHLARMRRRPMRRNAHHRCPLTLP